MKINIDSVRSIGIRNEYIAAHCNHANFFGTFRHPAHLNSSDWCITLYTVCDEPVFETNGDPVWSVTNPDAFASLLDEYGIDLQSELAE